MTFITFNKVQLAIHIHNYHHGLQTECVDEMFPSNNANHKNNTRYSNQLRIPKHNTHTHTYTHTHTHTHIIKYTVTSLVEPKIWNSITT